MAHQCSVFNNLCLKVPVDPISKMPKTAYERKKNPILDHQSSIDSVSICSASPGIEAEKLKDFYHSIPDYNDINHLPEEEFYFTLKSLREKKKKMLNFAIEYIDDNGLDKVINYDKYNNEAVSPTLSSTNIRHGKCKLNNAIRNSCPNGSKENKTLLNCELKTQNHNLRKVDAVTADCKKNPFKDSQTNNMFEEVREAPIKNSSVKDKSKSDRPKRNFSSCSISWNDGKMERKDEVDRRFDEFFDRRKFGYKVDVDDEFKTRSMPSSPIRRRRNTSPTRKTRNITIPKPFKMTERDEEDRIVNELRSIQKSFSEDMLNAKCERRQFRANPVPIESRIPLYDKILEDQAMRRAISKINSEAELRAQIKPFRFMKREEKGIGGLCERAALAAPKTKKKKRFRARPVPKNLFSNYFYDKVKEDEFFRSMNRKIRAEEMLRVSNYPGTMRDRSRLSTPAAHSDLPIDPSPAIPSATSSDRQRAASPVKGRRKAKLVKDNMITTSPQPFKFSTADRAAKKMNDITQKINQESVGNSAANTPAPRAYSALDLRATVSGRSNLAALLRAESVRRRFEIEASRRLAEHRRRLEMRQRDRLLRSKPAWHLVKNNHEEDIAMRLQTRRDEEKMRREEFLHEMELMYGRVQEQPMLFERYYAPRPYYLSSDTLQLSSRKGKRSSKAKSHHYTSPNRSRKVSINDTAEMLNVEVGEYLDRIDNDKLSFDSEVAIDSLHGGKV
ncbi:hypothetical protein ACJJTC_013222 [Scirpophaga incertulas]